MYSLKIYSPRRKLRSHPKLYPHLINNIQSELSTGGAKGNVEKPQKVPAQPESWPKDPILGLASRRRAGFGLRLSSSLSYSGLMMTEMMMTMTMTMIMMVMN